MRVFRIFNSSVTDQPTNQPTDQRTDKASYRVACPQLKTDSIIYFYIQIALFERQEKSARKQL